MRSMVTLTAATMLAETFAGAVQGQATCGATGAAPTCSLTGGVVDVSPRRSRASSESP